MAQYILYPLSDDGVVEAYAFRCNDAAEAYENAMAMLSQVQAITAIEVWEGGKRAFVVKQTAEVEN